MGYMSPSLNTILILCQMSHHFEYTFRKGIFITYQKMNCLFLSVFCNWGKQFVKMCRAVKFFVVGKEKRKAKTLISALEQQSRKMHYLMPETKMETFSAPLHTAAITPKFLITSGNFHIDLLHRYNYKQNFEGISSTSTIKVLL